MTPSQALRRLVLSEIAKVIFAAHATGIPPDWRTAIREACEALDREILSTQKLLVDGETVRQGVRELDRRRRALDGGLTLG